MNANQQILKILGRCFLVKGITSHDLSAKGLQKNLSDNKIDCETIDFKNDFNEFKLKQNDILLVLSD